MNSAAGPESCSRLQPAFPFSHHAEPFSQPQADGLWNHQWLPFSCPRLHYRQLLITPISELSFTFTPPHSVHRTPHHSHFLPGEQWCCPLGNKRGRKASPQEQMKALCLILLYSSARGGYNICFLHRMQQQQNHFGSRETRLSPDIKPAAALILDYQPARLWKISICCLEITQPQVFFCSSMN